MLFLNFAGFCNIKIDHSWLLNLFKINGSVESLLRQINGRKDNKQERKRNRVCTRKKSMFVCLLRWLTGIDLCRLIIQAPSWQCPGIRWKNVNLSIKKLL